MSAVVKLFRWLLILPAAIAVVPAADWISLQSLELIGASRPDALWVAGRIVAHLIAGAAAILLGAWIAPARKRTIATLLFVLAILGAIEATASGQMPLWLVLPLAAAFLAGAFLALRRIRRG
jgi:hypothetical protein